MIRRKPLALFLKFASLLVGLWLIAPLLIVVPLSFTSRKSLRFPPDDFSFRWYKTFVTSANWMDSLGKSLLIASLTTILALVLGVSAAFGINRTRFKLKGALQAFLIAPIIVPIVALGVGTYSLFLEWGLTSTFLGFVFAHTVLAVPYVVITTLVSLAAFDRRLEFAAYSLGAKRLRTFFSVTFPGIRAGVLAGALFAFVTSFDETVVSLFLQGPMLRTLPVEMYLSVTNEVDPTMAVIGTVVIFLVIVAVSISMTRTSNAKA